MLKIVMRLDVRVTCFYIHARHVYRDLDVGGLSRIVWLSSVRESTYIRSSHGSRRRSTSRYLPHTRIRDTHY